MGLRLKILFSSLFIALFLPFIGEAQQRNWQILSPLPNSLIGNQNLLISLGNDIDLIGNESDFYLDGSLISGIKKQSEHRIDLLCTETMSDGKHVLIANVYLKSSARMEQIKWVFYVNFQTEDLRNKKDKSLNKPFYITGSIGADNRSTILSGPGSVLRQEPSLTRTLMVDLTLNKGDFSMPIRYFNTSDNSGLTQSRDFFQIGFHRKWLEMDYGDINPNIDKLVLSGVRIRGFRVKIKVKGNSLQFFQGEMNSAIEGSLESYFPGSGVVPINLVNDSQYMLPGTYKRNMLGGRLEFGGKKENFKLGINGFKAKDDISSIKYGILPKDNVVFGSDMFIKLFKKKLTLSVGVAASMFTNDISYGVIDPIQIDTTLGLKIGFDPKQYSKFIIINASTIPAELNLQNMLAYFGTIQFNNRIHSFMAEYKHNGPQYMSLGNPFLRNNYEGYLLSEKIGIFNRKIQIGVNYQNYSNNLNQSLPSKLNTESMGTNLQLNVHPKWPVIMVNYMLQNRNSKSELSGFSGINDQITYWLMNINFPVKFWNVQHVFRAVYSVNNRKDLLRTESGTTFNNYLFGVTENLGKHLSVGLDYGNSNVLNFTNNKMNEIQTLSALVSSRFFKDRLNIIASYNQNKSIVTIISAQTIRYSGTLRVSYALTKKLIWDVEGGYMPYLDQVNNKNNYDEKYVYTRLTYTFR